MINVKKSLKSTIRGKRYAPEDQLITVNLSYAGDLSPFISFNMLISLIKIMNPTLFLFTDPQNQGLCTRAPVPGVFQEKINK